MDPVWTCWQGNSSFLYGTQELLQYEISGLTPVGYYLIIWHKHQLLFGHAENTESGFLRCLCDGDCWSIWISKRLWAAWPDNVFSVCAIHSHPIHVCILFCGKKFAPISGGSKHSARGKFNISNYLTCISLLEGEVYWLVLSPLVPPLAFTYQRFTIKIPSNSLLCQITHSPPIFLLVCSSLCA